MSKLTKAISLGMAAALLSASLPNLAAADHGDRGRRYHAREYRDDNRRHRDYKRYKKEWRQPHVKERRHKKVVVHKHHEKRVVVHKHKHKYKHSYDPWPLLAVVGITAAVLHANAAQAQARPAVRYVEPQPAPQYVPEPEPQGPASTCLMTREYQTQIVVHGKLVDGYGHACLQPDGSWYRGPAVAINY